MRDVPVGIDIDRGYGDSLWGKDVRFENVRQAAVVISNENNVFTQIGFDNALARNTPVFAQFRDSGRTVNGKGQRVSCQLLQPRADCAGSRPARPHCRRAPTWFRSKRCRPRDPPAIRALPPVAEWANAHELGVVGDGKADDTAALQRAIDSSPHRLSAAGCLQGHRHYSVRQEFRAHRPATEPHSDRAGRRDAGLPGCGRTESVGPVSGRRRCDRLRCRTVHRRRQSARHRVAVERRREFSGR